MKKYITINGNKAYIHEKENINKAIESAQNICDHSKEVIVREINEITDYTIVYENKISYSNEMQKRMNELIDKFDKDPLLVRISKIFMEELKEIEKIN